MTKTIDRGCIQLANTTGYAPFTINFEDMEEAVQVDVSGRGLLNFRCDLDADLELEIHTLIENALREYSTRTSHDSSRIGYSINLLQSNTLNRKWGVFETDVELTIIFQKPEKVAHATASQLQPTIELITNYILGEVFILQRAS